MSEPYMSEVKLFGCNFAPRGWSWCEGQLLAISTYQSLYSLLGTAFGGDGRTSFGLPDLRGRIPIGQGTGPGLSTRVIGHKGGFETVHLTTGTMPVHNHSGSAHATSAGSLSGSPTVTTSVKCNNTDDASTTDPLGKVWGKSAGRENLYADNIGTDEEMHPDLVTVNVDMSPVTVDVSTTVNSVTVGSAGSSMAHENMAPFIAIPYSIATIGLYPSRN